MKTVVGFASEFDSASYTERLPNEKLESFGNNSAPATTVKNIAVNNQLEDSASIDIITTPKATTSKDGASIDIITTPKAMTSKRGVHPADEPTFTNTWYYATGNMLISVADFLGVSKSSACRIVERVSIAIASLAEQYIQMYQSNVELDTAAQEFYQIARFPRVIGAIDCTLIKVQSFGGEDAEIFRSKKGFFALNVQTVSDTNLRIRNVVARWPGSTHDQTIYNNSNLKQNFENGRYGRFMLIGDSGYTIQPYLMTPFQHIQTPAENLYNESIIRTRNVVERQYGVWKRRFPILSLGIRVKLQTVMTIVVATAVLHNIAIDMNEVLPDEWFDGNADVEENENAIEENNAYNSNRGRDVRMLLVNEHFARL